MIDDNLEPVEDEKSKKIQKVITGGLVVKKKSLLNRFTSTFFGDDAANVGQYVLYDILIPAAKDTLQDMVAKGFERLLFGESVRGDRTTRDRDRSIVSYGKFYRGGRDRDRDRDRREPLRINSRSTYNFDDLVIRDRGEAEAVLSKLVDMIDEYDACSVSDFYDMLGVTTDYTDRKYGWDNLGRATIDRVRDGWIINLPNPIRLD